MNDVSESSSYARDLISCLPAELLAQIFFTVAVDTFSRTSVHTAPGPSSRELQCIADGRIVISHVCRHWRAVARDTPVIWSYLRTHDTPPAVLDEFIVRSGQAPLRVCCTPHPRTIRTLASPDPITLRVLASQIHRIKELELVIRDKDAASVFDWEAPLLEVLTLRNIGGGQPRVRVSASSLRHVDLWSVQFRWADWGAYPLLATLRVWEPAGTEGSVGTVEDMLAALGRMPVLEDLALASAFPLAFSDTEPSRPIGLPRLKRLQLEDDSASCAALLRHIDFPANFALSLSVSDDPDGLADLMRRVAGVLSRPGSRPVKSLVIQQSLSLHVEAYTAPDTPADGVGSEFGSPAGPLFNASLTVDVEIRPSDKLHALRLLSALLPRLTHIDALHLSSWYYPDLVYRLLDLMRAREALPALRELTIHLPHMPYVADGPSWQREIGRWLSERAAHGLPVAKLRLHRCVESGADLQPLRAIAPALEIEWHPAQ